MANSSNSTRKEIIGLQKEIYWRQKKRIEAATLSNDPELYQFEKRYNQVVSKYTALSSMEEVKTAINQSNLVFLGDYHTSRQSQKMMIKLLQMISGRRKNIFLCMEFVHSQYQDALNRYMEGKIQDNTFLQRIKYKQNWGFDNWNNFKPIFDLAKSRNIKIRAIDSPNKSIRKREIHSAQIITDILADNPGVLVVVFIGDLHIGPEHLPAAVNYYARKKGIKTKPLIIFQNSEDIYWKLAARGKEQEVDVVKLAGGNYCILNTTPVIKLQSFLNYLEADQEWSEDLTPQELFCRSVKILVDFFQINIQDELEWIDVFAGADISLLSHLQQYHNFSKKQLAQVKSQILNCESYFIPNANTVYLATLSLNHAGEEATHFIHYCAHKLSGKNLNYQLPPEDYFYFHIIFETLGFCGSKVINHRRKCPVEITFRRIIRDFEENDYTEYGRDDYVVAKLVISHKKQERTKGYDLGIKNINKRRPDIIMALTHALGYLMGSKLYYAMIRNRVNKDYVRSLFYQSLDKPEQAKALYVQLVKRVGSIRVPHCDL